MRLQSQLDLVTCYKIIDTNPNNDNAIELPDIKSGYYGTT